MFLEGAHPEGQAWGHLTLRGQMSGPGKHDRLRWEHGSLAAHCTPQQLLIEALGLSCPAPRGFFGTPLFTTFLPQV